MSAEIRLQIIELEKLRTGIARERAKKRAIRFPTSQARSW